MPKVSVIVPIYKVEKYLRTGVESILAQTYKDYEIILVDDGSPDSCGQICDEYAEKYENIRVVHKENGGLSSARNAGLDVAKGKYVYFFDPDDRISPLLLEKCVERIENDGSDAVRFGYYCTGDWEEFKVGITANNSFEICDTGENKHRFIVDKIFKNSYFSAWGYLYSGEIIKKNALRFADNNKIFAEDMYFICQFVLYANKISFMDEMLYYYYIREDSIMGKIKDNIKLKEISLLSETLFNQVNDEYIRENYEVIHHLIILNQINRIPVLQSIKSAKRIDDLIASVENKDFFDKYNILFYRKHFKEYKKQKGFYCSLLNKYICKRNKVIFTIEYSVWRLFCLLRRFFSKFAR